jgi:hypothetical protein
VCAVARTQGPTAATTCRRGLTGVIAEGSDGKDTVFLVAGSLYPPNSPGVDGVYSSGTFGTDGWRAVVSDLGLVLGMGLPMRSWSLPLRSWILTGLG